MAGKLKEFEEWLASRLVDLNADEAVFGPYIQSLLEDSGDIEDQEEALEALLTELVGQVEAKSLRVEICSRWKSVTAIPIPSPGDASVFAHLNPNTNVAGGGAKSKNLSLDNQLDEILRIASESIEEKASSRLEAGKGPSSSSGALGQPDSQLRAKILSQMNNETDSDTDDDPSAGPSKKKTSESSLPSDVGRHANVSKVLNEQKEVRDNAKAEAAKKKERDKDDRAKQKATAQERKDKAKKKATKVERKR